MPINVGKGLLHHAQDRPLKVWRQLVNLLRNSDPGDQPRSPRKAFGEIPQCGLEAILRQVRGMQQIGENAQFPERFAK